LFAQGERALDRSQGGLGIGLTLVQRLAELHGGAAEARSEGTDKGAEFTVRLPAVEAPAEIAHQRTETKSVRCHVGLVEDNQDARSSLALLLRSEGHEVHEAADGPAGVELLADSRIQIAFIDIGLPGMSGFEVAKAVRAGRGADIRLVAMSGYGADQDLEQGGRSGFDAYIIKPAEFDRVQAQFARLAEGSAT
jgi:CheY-like chemotaxis protein